MDFVLKGVILTKIKVLKKDLMQIEKNMPEEIYMHE